MKCPKHPEVEMIFMERRFVCPLSKAYAKYKLRETGKYVDDKTDSNQGVEYFY